MATLVTRTSMPPFEEYVDEIKDLWDSHWVTNMGSKHRRFEAALKSYLGCDYLTLFTNGHSTLECAIEAFGLTGEVITTPFTFASTTHAIVRKGLTPVFADIKPDDCTINPASIEHLITPRTSAIIPVHVYGNLCDIEAIQKIADSYGLKVIYDAAHAFGVKLNGVSAAVFGDASMFSFHATKVFNSIEGGAVCFKDPALKNTLNELKNFGIVGPEEVECIGGNAKMNEFCAAMGLCNLRHVEDEISARAKVENYYRDRLSGVQGLTFIDQQPGIESNHAYMPVFFEDSFGATRDEIFEALFEQGIVSRKYFYPLTSDFACYRNSFDSSETPIAKDRANRVLALPMYGGLSEEEVNRICNVIISCSI